MSGAEMITLAVTGVLAIAGLFLAASHMELGFVSAQMAGLTLSIGSVLVAYYMVKRHFDRRDADPARPGTPGSPDGGP